MESLLCDEVWDMSPADEQNGDRSDEAHGVVEKCKKEDCEEAFGILLEKEVRYMPEPGYANHLKLNRFIDNARSKGVHWLIMVSSFKFSLFIFFCFDSYMHLYAHYILGFVDAL